MSSSYNLLGGSPNKGKKSKLKNNNTDNNLPLLSSSSLTVPISGSLITSNPAIDLTATVGADANNTIYVWRNTAVSSSSSDHAADEPSNPPAEETEAGPGSAPPADDRLVSKHTAAGERSYGAQQGAAPKTVQALRWKEDGSFLAAGWSDGVVRLMGMDRGAVGAGMAGRSLYSIKVGDGAGNGNKKIGLVGWGRNRVKKRENKGGGKGGGNDVGEMEVEGLGKLGGGELAHELEFLEVEGALPKLSPLPVSGGSGDDMFLFSTTTSLEFVFRPLKAEDADDVHVMVVGMEDGGIHLSIYDSFVIGTFRYEDSFVPRETVFELCGHSSRPETATHMLLMRPKGGDGSTLHVVPMDLTFVHYSPVNLSLLSSKVTTLQNLLRYVRQAQSHMTGEWKSTRELPSRFLLGVQDDLKKMGTGDLTIVQALYHTVVTGHVFPPVKEWLVDVVAERGHKRWEKAVVSGLLNLRSLVHENFIPALERCGIILSRLLGIARFHESSESIGFNAIQISKLMDVVSCLMVVANKVLLQVMSELEHFTAFSIWLRLEIDKQASSTVSEELTEKEATMDNAKVLLYIQRYLITSPLAMYFDEDVKGDYAKDEKLVDDGPSLLQLLDKELQKQESGQDYLKTLPHIGFLVNYLANKAGAVFQNIAEAEKRGVRFGEAAKISIGTRIWKEDVLLCAPSESLAEANTAVVPENNKNIIYLFKIEVAITNGMSGSPFTEAVGVRLMTGATIIDFSFLDEKSLLLLCRIEEEPRHVLIRVAYRKIQYEPVQEGQIPPVLEIGTRSHDDDIFPQFGFAHMSGFTPVQMEVLKANDLRGDLPARVCLVGRDKAMYKTYRLPEGWDKDKDRPAERAEEE